MRTRLIAAMLAATTLIAACGDGDDAGGDDAAPTTDVATVATEATASTTTATTATTGGSTGHTAAQDEAPQAIVSLSPVHTEMLFAIGAGDQVIAVDDQSDYPPEAAAVMTDLSGFEPNIEAIASYEPDLVIAQSDSVQAPLDELGIEVWVGLAAPTLEDAYAQIEQLGAVTGHIAEAAEVVAAMQTDIEAIVESVPDLDEALTVADKHVG